MTLMPAQFNLAPQPSPKATARGDESDTPGRQKAPSTAVLATHKISARHPFSTATPDYATTIQPKASPWLFVNLCGPRQAFRGPSELRPVRPTAPQLLSTQGRAVRRTPLRRDLEHPAVATRRNTPAPNVNCMVLCTGRNLSAKTTKSPVVAQFDCHPEQAFFAQSRDLGEPREASRTLRRNNRAFGSLPYQTEPLQKAPSVGQGFGNKHSNEPSLLSGVGFRRAHSGAHVPANLATRVARVDVVEVGFVLLLVGILLVNHGEFFFARLL